MTFSIVTPFIQSAVTAILFVLVLRAPGRSSQTRWFQIFLAAMSLWGLFIGIMSNSSLDAALLWEKAALVMISLTVVSFYYFTAGYTKPHTRIKSILPALHLIGTLALIPTPLLVSEIYIDEFGNAPGWEIMFYPWVVSLYTMILAAIINLYQARKQATTYEAKNRYFYMIAGTSLCFMGGISDILPFLGIPIYPLSIVANIGFAILTSIAISRFHLLDVHIVIRKSVAYLITSTLVAIPYVGLIVFFGDVLRQRLSPWVHVFILLAVALVLQTLWRWVQRMVDKMFFRDQYDFLKDLDEFSQQTHDISNLDQLGMSLLGLISRAFQSENIHLLLLNESDNFRTVARTGTGPEYVSIPKRSPLIKYFSEHKNILFRVQIDIDPKLQTISSREKNEIDNLKAQLFVPIKTNDGELVGLLLMGPKKSQQPYSEEDVRRIVTVTSRVSIELENARLYAQEMATRKELQRQDEQKTEFLHHVAHELKTPLTAIISSSELMTAEDIVNIPYEQRERLLNNINRSAWLMDRKVGELLDLARIQIGRLELNLTAVDLSDIIEDLTSQLSSLFKNKEQSLEMLIPTTLPRAKCDRERTTEILLNLLSNANKFSPAGGHISIRATENNGIITLEVKDTAAIIQESDRDKIFNPYYRSGTSEEQQRVSGLGLGLAISKRLVELQNGEIGVSCEEGKGNTFYFTLPVWTEETTTRDKEGIES